MILQRLDCLSALLLAQVSFVMSPLSSTFLSKNVERYAQQGLRILLGASWEAFQGLGRPLEGSGTALGRLLGGSWQAFGGFQEASWTKDRHGYNF